MYVIVLEFKNIERRRVVNLLRIVHICLANFYVDGMGYQENLLPKHHAKEHEVLIVASDFSFDPSGNRTKKIEKNYLNEYGIPVKVLEKSTRYGFYSRYKDFERVYETLHDFKPDIIFCHGGQFIALKDVINYCKKNKNVKFFIDQHADFYNTPVNTLRKRMAQWLIYGYWMRKAVPYVDKFWGVTPWRCQYLHEVYGLPENKIDLLIMGGDDDKIDFENQHKIRKKIRAKYKFADDDMLIITGGKIDKEKNIHLLINAVKEIDYEKVKLLVFGQPSDKYKDEFLQSIENIDKIKYIGWISSDESYDYFLAADLAVFPGTHSVLWEQACACGLPGLFRYWEGMQHVDVGGNALFLREDSKDEIKRVLLDFIKNPEKLANMKKVAQEKAVEIFSYRKIAKRAILED